ncbi:hypothetical protein KAR91_68890 [Candidatus Pacearchaeota archaeon]|nr:hypothetical protein [Candidatus Pacearchaeota archaeon]
MAQCRLSRQGRRREVLRVVKRLTVVHGYATMTQVARVMGMKPSTYINNLLRDLWEVHSVDCEVVSRSNGGIVRHWNAVGVEMREA